MRPLLSAFALSALACAGSFAASAPTALTLLGPDQPRAFFFRQAEGLAAQRRMSYEVWSRNFGGLMGIMGKVLEEEVPGRSRGLDYFVRFKRDHPEQAVLIHINGNARDPRWESQRFFAGHWLYHNGTTILDPLPATPGEITVRVSDATLFEVDAGRYKNANDDIGLCELGADGRPDWSRAEQVQLLALDRRAKTIRIRRACYGTVPRAFAAGKTYAAAHCVEGPWGGDSHLLWFYNYSTTCPRDAQGRTCADVWSAHLAELFGSAGPLHSLDGLEFDVMFHTPNGSARPRRGPDCDADGRRDNGLLNGLNVYGNGVFAFCAQLRAALGENKLILADGAFRNDTEQRATGLLNGIESEGWPVLGDFKIDDWSGGLNRHEFWRTRSRAPALNYANVKFVEAGESPGKTQQAAVPFSSVRLAFAGAVLTDSAITFAHRAPGPRSDSAIWDELVAGTGAKPGWLGRALSPTQHLAELAPDLLGGAGHPVSAALQSRLVSDDAKVELDGVTLRITAKTGTARGFSVRIAGLKPASDDLTVVLTARAAPISGCPPGMARLVHATLTRPGGATAVGKPIMAWVDGEEFTSRFYFRSVPKDGVDVVLTFESPEAVWIKALAIHAAPDCSVRVFEHGLVLANPSDTPHAFDLATLAPGSRFRRFVATPQQDASVNNGRPAEPQLTLPAHDALFLVRD